MKMNKICLTKKKGNEKKEQRQASSTGKLLTQLECVHIWARLDYIINQ